MYQQTPTTQPIAGVPIQSYTVGGFGNTNTTTNAALYGNIGTVPYSGAPHGVSGSNAALSPSKFQGSTYNDVWAAVLWVASVLAVIIVGFYKVSQSHPDLPSDISYGQITGYTVFAVVVASTLSIPLHYLMRRHAETLIYFGNVAYIVFLGVLALASFIGGQVFSGVILIIFTLFYIWWFSVVRDRIPFAAMCLQSSAEIVHTYNATVLNAFGWLLVQVVFIIMWSCGLYTSAGQGFDGNNFVTWLWLLLFYWSTQVFTGIVHVTTCGVVAMSYFTGAAMPANPTLGSLRRATTFSLGSICFGSLVVAILKLMRTAANQATRHDNEFVRCVVMCIVNCLENLMEYFNEYAYVHIAVYGKSYLSAARDTWHLVVSSGILAIINDQLLQFVYVMFVFGGGLITGVACMLLSWSWVYFLLGLIIGMVVVSLVAGVVQSGVMTIFVCFAEEPMALQRSNPALYEALNAAMAGQAPSQV